MSALLAAHFGPGQGAGGRPKDGSEPPKPPVRTRSLREVISANDKPVTPTSFARFEAQSAGGDERPPGLASALSDPSVAMVIDASVEEFDEAGYGVVKTVHTVFKPTDGSLEPPQLIRGYKSMPGRAMLTTGGLALGSGLPAVNDVLTVVQRTDVQAEPSLESETLRHLEPGEHVEVLSVEVLPWSGKPDESEGHTRVQISEHEWVSARTPGKVAPLRLISGRTGRFLFLLSDEPTLLHGTYDHMFRIQPHKPEDKDAEDAAGGEGSGEEPEGELVVETW